MQDGNGKWRYTSPTHVVRAFCQAMVELELEGGVTGRYNRYSNNQKKLVEGMKKRGFETLLPQQVHSPIITAFYYPKNINFTFGQFYSALKKQGYVIYPGKISKAETFRIGNIGDIHVKDIEGLLVVIEDFLKQQPTQTP
jgi:2-aminoethylphosphonate-pyruvate transaminase